MESILVADSAPRENSARFNTIALLAVCATYVTIIGLVPFDAIKDRSRYLIHAEQWDTILALRWNLGAIYMPFQEVGWLLLLGLFRTIFDPRQTIWLMTVIPATWMSLLVVKATGKNLVALIIILSMPLILKHNFSQIREGVALCFFLTGLLVDDRRWKWPLLAMAALVHVGFFIVGALYVATVAFDRMSLPPRTRLLTIGIIATAMLVAVPAAGILLETRQGNRYALFDPRGSGAAFVFWGFILALFVSAGWKEIERNLFAISILIFYLASYFVLPYSARFFEAGAIFVLISGLMMAGIRSHIFAGAIAVFSTYYYFLERSVPWFGFGIA